MPETKFSPKRRFNSTGQRQCIRQPIGQINHPGREKEDRAISLVERDVKHSRKKPEPSQRHERRVETDQIQPYGRRDFRARLWTPQRGVPTRGGIRVT